MNSFFATDATYSGPSFKEIPSTRYVAYIWEQFRSRLHSQIQLMPLLRFFTYHTQVRTSLTSHLAHRQLPQYYLPKDHTNFQVGGPYGADRAMTHEGNRSRGWLKFIWAASFKTDICELGWVKWIILIMILADNHGVDVRVATMEPATTTVLEDLMNLDCPNKPGLSEPQFVRLMNKLGRCGGCGMILTRRRTVLHRQKCVARFGSNWCCSASI